MGNDNNNQDLVMALDGIRQAITAQNILNGIVPYKARIFATASTSLPGGDSKVNLQSKTYDSGDMFDAANSRIKIPVAGLYDIKGCVAIGSAGANHGCQLRINGVLTTIGDERNTSAATQQLRVNDELWLNKGDYVEMFAYNSGGTVNTLTGSFRTYMSIRIVAIQ